MALLSFPLSLAQFFDLLPIEAMTFGPADAVEVDETAGGEVLTASLGPPLWRGRLDLAALTHAEAQAIVPLLNLLRRPGGSFMIGDPRRLTPLADPGGVSLGLRTSGSLPLAPAGASCRSGTCRQVISCRAAIWSVLPMGRPRARRCTNWFLRSRPTAAARRRRSRSRRRCARGLPPIWRCR